MHGNELKGTHRRIQVSQFGGQV